MNDKQTLTLEAGKYYRTREGQKVFVAALNLFNDDSDHPVAVIIGNHDVEGELQWYAPSGKYNAYGGDLAEDLVAEWVEPKRIKGKCYLMGEGISARMGAVFVPAGCNVEGLEKLHPLACVEIDIPEGYGLNGEAA